MSICFLLFFSINLSVTPDTGNCYSKESYDLVYEYISTHSDDAEYFVYSEYKLYFSGASEINFKKKGNSLARMTRENGLAVIVKNKNQAMIVHEEISNLFCQLYNEIVSIYAAEDLPVPQDTVFIRTRDYSKEGVSYSTDTVIFTSFMDRTYLVGTTILPSTRNQLNARGHDLYLIEVNLTPCNNEADRAIPDKVISTYGTDTTLVIGLSVTANCCYNFLCDISIVDDSLLNIIYYGYGETHCACECCFGLEYNLEIVKRHDNFPSVKGIILNGRKENIYSLKK